MLAILLGGPAAFAAGKDLVVLDLYHMTRNADGSRQRGYESSWGDWEKTKNVGQVNEQGLLVNLVGSKGGVGEDRGLDFRKHSLARLTFVIGNRNRADSFSFALLDKDGTEQNWDVSLKDQPKGATLNPLIDLTKPSREDKPGKTPGLDLKKLKTWQIKGNYQDASIEILFIKVTAVSE